MPASELDEARGRPLLTVLMAHLQGKGFQQELFWSKLCSDAQVLVSMYKEQVNALHYGHDTVHTHNTQMQAVNLILQHCIACMACGYLMRASDIRTLQVSEKVLLGCRSSQLRSGPRGSA